MLDLHRLRLLKEFAARGTIAATAAAMGYTPSAVSQQLAALEREAGMALLDRTARSAELTDAGLRLAAHAERILAQVEEAEADLSAAAREPSGRVSVAAFPTAAAAFAPALARSLRAHPGLTLLLRQTQRAEGLRQVSSAEVDVALVDDWSGGLGGPESALLRFYPLVRDPLVLAGGGGAPPVPWEFEGLGTILSLVAKGIGIAAVPRLALAAGDARVAVRELPEGSPAREVYAVARAASVRRPSVAVILTVLHDGVEHLPGRGGRSRLVL